MKVAECTLTVQRVEPPDLNHAPAATGITRPKNYQNNSYLRLLVKRKQPFYALFWQYPALLIQNVSQSASAPCAKVVAAGFGRGAARVWRGLAGCAGAAARGLAGLATGAATRAAGLRWTV